MHNLHRRFDFRSETHCGEVLRAFSLIELLVVIAVIGVLLTISLPTLSSARHQARGAKCLSQLRSLGQALTMYTLENGDVFVPGRLPKVDTCNWSSQVEGGRKYRPTFLAMMSSKLGIKAFDDPQECGDRTDVFGEPGGRQNYASDVFVCPSVANWTDERNGSYGYNYQFLGNSRLSGGVAGGFKNWPVLVGHIRAAAATVAVGDCMGTAASFGRHARGAYQNNSRDAFRLGNEGFNLDPPHVDAARGEMAGLSHGHRSSVDPRHRGKSNVLFVDGHGESRTPVKLGYRINADGVVGFDGSNAMWSGDRRDVAWQQAL